MKKPLIYSSIIILIITIIGIIIFLSVHNTPKYNYLMLQSTYTASEEDPRPGADIQGIEINIKGLKFYPVQIVNHKNMDILLDEPENNIKNSSYISLGNKNETIILKTKIDLKDPNLRSITVYEYSLGDLKEAYNIYISHSEKGPWEYLMSGAGAMIYTP
jgi:hypothetical protein